MSSGQVVEGHHAQMGGSSRLPSARCLSVYELKSQPMCFMTVIFLYIGEKLGIMHKLDNKIA